MPPAQRRIARAASARSEDQETIDINNVSDSEPEPDPRAERVTQVAIADSRTARSMQSVDSLDSQSKKSSTTRDIVHFFTPKVLGQDRHCIACKTAFDALENKAEWPKGRNFKYSPNTGSTGLRSHLERFHAADYLKLAKEQNWVVQLPHLKAKMAAAAVVNAKKQIMFSADAVTDHLVRFIAANDQSINVVESRQFRDLLLLFRDDYTEEDMPHRTRVRQAVIEAWQSWFLNLKLDLKKSVGALAFTADIWSDRCRQSFICITVHWLTYERPDKHGLTLKSSLLAFHPLYGPHSGRRIAEVVYALLERAGVTCGNGAHWTLDNASNNDKFLDCLKSLYGRCRPEVVFDHIDCRIPCFPHIINICAQHTIKSLNNGIDNDIDDEVSASDGDEDTNTGGDTEDDPTLPVTMPTDLLNRIRALIRAIRASGQRQEAFAKTITAGNELGWWTDDKDQRIMLAPLKLLRDVKTRWDSTYQMLVRFRIFRQPLDHFLNVDSAVKDLKKYRLSSMDWARVTDIIGVLRYPHLVQEVMSKEKTPVLAGVIPTFERFMSSWETLARAKENRHLKDALETGLEFAKKYYNKMDNTNAFVIAMFIHPAIRMNWINKHWDTEYIESAEAVIKGMMAKYRKKYNIGVVSANAAAASSKTTKTSLGYVNLGLPSNLNIDDDDDLNWDDNNKEILSLEAEYQGYAFGSRPGIDTDLLLYWELRREEFPTIFAIAMDYLPIQASSVPCERAFSSSSETDTVRRNRISPILMEALQMLKFAVRNTPIDFTSDILTPEKELEGDTAPNLLAELTNEAHDDERRENVIDRVVFETQMEPDSD